MKEFINPLATAPLKLIIYDRFSIIYPYIAQVLNFKNIFSDM